MVKRETFRIVQTHSLAAFAHQLLAPLQAITPPFREQLVVFIRILGFPDQSTSKSQRFTTRLCTLSYPTPREVRRHTSELHSSRCGCLCRTTYMEGGLMCDWMHAVYLSPTLHVRRWMYFLLHSPCCWQTVLGETLCRGRSPSFCKFQ